MKRMKLLRYGLLVFWVNAIVFAADASRNALTWDEFSNRADPSQKIRLVLPDGTLVEGRPLDVNPDALRMQITKSSNNALHPKGTEQIPRASVRVVEMRGRGTKGRWIGTLAPLGVGTAILVGTAICMGSNAGCPDVVSSGEPYNVLAVGGIVAAAGTPIGYFVGRSVDRRPKSYNIVPGTSAPKP